MGQTIKAEKGGRRKHQRGREGHTHTKKDFSSSKVNVNDLEVTEDRDTKGGAQSYMNRSKGKIVLV